VSINKLSRFEIRHPRNQAINCVIALPTAVIVIAVYPAKRILKRHLVVKAETTTVTTNRQAID
jgi:hypothetical protein